MALVEMQSGAIKKHFILGVFLLKNIVLKSLHVAHDSSSLCAFKDTQTGLNPRSLRDVSHQVSLNLRLLSAGSRVGSKYRSCVLH